MSDEMKEVNFFLVEDDEIDVESIQRAFYRLGYKPDFVWARDGEEALDVLNGNHSKTITPPFILLLDLNMPGMGGLELLSEIRRDPDLSALIIFVLTTSVHQKDVDYCYQHNVAGYFQKKGDLTQVVKLLRQYIDNAELPRHWKIHSENGQEKKWIENCKILVIEDDEVHCEYIQREFAKKRMEDVVVFVSDGEEALYYLKRATDSENQSLPDLILLDMGLPGIDGMELIQKLVENSQWGKIPIIVMSSDEVHEDILQKKGLKMANFVRKSVKYDELCRKIKQMKLPIYLTIDD